ncbi:DUF4129 domain-containing transglutaminase family protein [Paenibacillus sp. FA6]|uniref:DUF4129 domain-containing transglutaminase family protein n=1 Tax=Paenibacillus sp. FA6 TaxID=3413029 RepID=UPI003F65CD0C
MTKRRPFLKYDWLAAFSFLWIWIVARQWLSFTEPVWYEETTSLVGRTVLIIIIIEVLLPLKRVYRIVAECALIILLLRHTLIEYGLYMPNGELNNWLEPFIMATQPYIWFVVSAAALSLLIAKFISSKRLIFMFMGLNIVALAILDSFTSEILWDEAGWMVFAMLGWLVSHHFLRFKQKYPQGWKHLLHYPFEMVAHIVLIFSVIFLLGVNMPKIAPVLTDPYTVWSEWRTTTPSTISEQVPADMDNAQPSTSGYSREDNELGGAFEFDYSLVMTVHSSKRSYWRGETRRLYSGTGWESESSKANSFENVQAGEELKRDSELIVETEKVEQTMTIKTDSIYPVLFGAYRISTVESIDGEKEMDGVQWKDSQAEIHWNTQENELSYPTTYSLTSEVPIIPVEQLSKQSYDELYNNSTEQSYLQIPDDFPKRVGELAVEITQSAETPYEKIALLQAYLQSNYEYTNTPDVSRKISGDFVDSFLFEILEGYCDYYSTSMVMMARSLDIPARWVKGYAPGSQPEIDELRMMQQGYIDTGTYTVSNADAHSWAEIYYGPYGWIPVEATPGFNMPLLTRMDDSDKDIIDQQEEQSDDDIEGSMDSGVKSAWMKGIAVAAMTILFIWLGYVGFRSRHSMNFLVYRLRRGKELTPNEKVVIETERWLRYLHKRGMIREQHDTLRESVVKWKKDAPTLERLLMSLLELFEKAKYSPEAVAAGEWCEVQRVADQLKQAIRAKSKR